MLLPNDVLYCIEKLNSRGFEAYAVGGCVRDALLGLTPHDYDLCTSASPAQICEIFHSHSLVRSGEKHGTVGVVLEKQVYEITTFRTEGSYTDGRHPDSVRFVKDVTQDLARRDFTVNAMAYHPEKGYIDPFGGRQDLKDGILRAVGDPNTRFSEDSLRILRGVRFAVRFSLTPEKETEDAMFRLPPLMERLARERVFDELCKLLPLVTAADLLRFAPVLTAVIPELKPMVGFDQHTRHHIYDIYTHTAHAVEGVPPELALRWAALLHDIGKPATFSQDEAGNGHFHGHAKVSAQMADQILHRLKTPNALREQVVLLIAQHMVMLEPDRKLLRRRLCQYGAQTLENMLLLQRADILATGVYRDPTPFEQTMAIYRQLLQEDACLKLRDLAVSGSDLLAIGYPAGPAVGQCLNRLFAMVVDEHLPNEKEALLKEAEEYRRNML